MRILGFLLATLAITNVVAQDSFCVKYTKAVFNKTTSTGTDEYNLIAAIVGRVVVGCNDAAASQFGITPTPTGIFAPYGKQACNDKINNITAVRGLVNDPLNAPFFAGTSTPYYQSQTGLQTLNDASGIGLAPSIRFVNVSGFDVTPNPAAVGAGASEGLIQHLVSFFGMAFGCSSYNSGTNTNATNPTFIGKYNGVGNMKSVHQNMNITMKVWTEFINTFVGTLKSFGVSDADITGMVQPVIAQFLLAPPGATTNNQICNQPDCRCIPGYNNDNNTGLCVAVATTSPPTNPPGNGTTTSPPTTPAPAGNGTTSPPTKAAASILSTSVATMGAVIAALLLAFL